MTDPHTYHTKALQFARNKIRIAAQDIKQGDEPFIPALVETLRGVYQDPESSSLTPVLDALRTTGPDFAWPAWLLEEARNALATTETMVRDLG